MHSNLGYDPIQDFSAISQLSRSLNALVVHPDVPARTLTEFVAHLKANPDQLHFGTAGVGSMGQLNAELFKSTLGVKAVHVPYRGGGPLISGLLSNQCSSCWTTWRPCCLTSSPASCAPGDRRARASGLPARRADLRRTWSSDAQHDLVDRAGGARRHAADVLQTLQAVRTVARQEELQQTLEKTAPCRPTNRRRPSSLP